MSSTLLLVLSAEIALYISHHITLKYSIYPTLMPQNVPLTPPGGADAPAWWVYHNFAPLYNTSLLNVASFLNLLLLSVGLLFWLPTAWSYFNLSHWCGKLWKTTKPFRPLKARSASSTVASDPKLTQRGKAASPAMEKASDAVFLPGFFIAATIVKVTN